jgi:hypothetical protein
MTKVAPMFFKMRGLRINCAPVLSVAIDENVTAIEGYGLGRTSVIISQKIHKGFLRGNKTTLFCFIVGD